MARAKGSSNTNKEVREAIYTDRQSGMSIAAVARKYGVDRCVVRQWGGILPVAVSKVTEGYDGPIRAGDKFKVNGRPRFVWSRRGGSIELRSYETGSSTNPRIQKTILTVKDLRKCRLLSPNPDGELLAIGHVKISEC